MIPKKNMKMMIRFIYRYTKVLYEAKQKSLYADVQLI